VSASLTGESLYERARDEGGVPWTAVGEWGKAIWRDAERLISHRLAALLEPVYAPIKRDPAPEHIPAETSSGRDRQVRGAGCVSPGERPHNEQHGRQAAAEIATGPPLDSPERVVPQPGEDAQ
jgi:hypothetical protein